MESKTTIVSIISFPEGCHKLTTLSEDAGAVSTSIGSDMMENRDLLDTLRKEVDLLLDMDPSSFDDDHQEQVLEVITNE